MALFGGEAKNPGPPNRSEIDSDLDDTQETAEGATPTNSFHVGPQVDILSDTELSIHAADVVLDGNQVVDAEMAEVLATLDDLFGDEVEVPAIVPPAPVPDQQPSLRRCPFCTGFASRGPVRGLMLHLSSKHVGSTVDDSA